MAFLDLPYDVRHKIYEHLFPPGGQIYIHAHGQHLVPMSRGYLDTMGLFSTCRALNTEGREHLYNNYLFNIIGTKPDCLATYQRFVSHIERHARHEVHVDAFSNGAHSQTMCISIHAGEGRMAMLKRRQRGEWKQIDELEKEVALTASRRPSRRVNAFPASRSFVHRVQTVGFVVAVLVAMLAWVLTSSLLPASVPSMAGNLQPSSQGVGP